MGHILQDSFMLEGSPIETIDSSTFAVTAKVEWQVPWARRAEMAFYWMNPFTLPPYPYSRQLVPIVPLSVDMAPFRNSATSSSVAGLSQLIDYEYAKVTVSFGPPKKASIERDISTRGGGDLISESIEPLDEFLTLNHENFVWASDGAPLEDGEDQGRMQIGLVYNFTRHNVDRVRPEFLLLSEHVNDKQITPLSSMLRTMNHSFERGTLLYKPGQVSRSIDVAGKEKITVSMKFLWRQTGWNQFWRSDLVNTIDGTKTAGGYDFIRLRNKPDGTKGEPYLNFPFGNLELL